MEETYATKKIYSFRLVVKTEQFKTFHRVWSKQVINVHSSLAGAVGRCVSVCVCVSVGVCVWLGGGGGGRNRRTGTS